MQEPFHIISRISTIFLVPKRVIPSTYDYAFSIFILRVKNSNKIKICKMICKSQLY